MNVSEIQTFEHDVLVIGAGIGGLSAAYWLIGSLRALPRERPVEPPPWRRARRYGLFVTGIVILDMVVWQRSELYFLERWHPAVDMARYGVAFNIAGALVRMAPTAMAAKATNCVLINESLAADAAEM